MNGKRSTLTGILAALIMFLLILDSKTALDGATQALELCFKQVIPSLFPFFVLSNLIVQMISGRDLKTLYPLGRLCRIPQGSEFLLLIGLIGGYPVGAQCISHCYNQGKLGKNDAERMLGFCNNAGPSFIFGMTTHLFSSPIVPWVVWSIQILSAILVSTLLPVYKTEKFTQEMSKEQTSNNIILTAVKSMAVVCGWIVVFRVILHILNRWLLWIIPEAAAIVLAGLLELTNGCVELCKHSDSVFCFISLSLLLSFGGLCVGLQTISVSKNLSCKYYFMGKLLQTLVSFPLSCIAAGILFPGNHVFITIGSIILAAMSLILVIRQKYKNYTGNLRRYSI